MKYLFIPIPSEHHCLYTIASMGGYGLVYEVLFM
jgi:hypothetical protein